MPRPPKLNAPSSAPATADVRSIDPIVRPALHLEVVERLRALIIEGTFLPGSRIPEGPLCEHLGVSRTPLREALKVLAAEGLVTLTPHRGATVTELDAQSVDYMFQVLETLEPLAGELACSHMSQTAIDEVCHWHHQMLQHYQRREHAEFSRLNHQIHDVIVKECGNPVLISIYEGLDSRVRYARYMSNLSAESWQRAVEEHNKILDALIARNGKRLARILRRHLRHKREYVKNMLSGSSELV